MKRLITALMYLATFAILMLILIYLNGCAIIKPVKWDKVEKGAMGVFVAGQGVNYLQTRRILHDQKWKELNPIIDRIYDKYGDGGLIAYKASSTFVVGGIAHILPRKYRKALLFLSNFIVLGVVGHDFMIGIRFGF